ncbi:3-isopropylmalate dehydratase small subunit [Oscillibacter sp.]|uniref:3-isopropylmalate dehydratase small subunit n=1 Tax=Oscillibacter sp. TaxID=1945593 RepID=UPI00289AA05F|nr:3-isopropylmalate dehydratase small subunit [Oscillibacter sp.]
MSSFSICGKVHRFGENINTDLISPANYIGKGDDIMIAHAMEGADPDFSKKVRPGDIIVAGENFGPGSSRETAPFVIKGSGISCVVAKSFARIFYRNAINIGLPVLILDEVEQIEAGDELAIDPLEGIIRNHTKNEEYRCKPLPRNIHEIVKDGGLIAHLKKQSGK